MIGFVSLNAPLHDPATCPICISLKVAVAMGDHTIICIHAPGPVCELCLNDLSSPPASEESP